MDDWTKTLSKISEWPWRTILILMSSAFVVAQVISFATAYFLMQFDIKKIRPRQAANLGAKLTRGSAETLKKSDLEAILKRNVFNSDGTLGDQDAVAKKGGDEDSTPAEDIPKTTLPIKIVGIIYGGTPFDGLATIENTTKKLINSFVVGDTIADGAIVSAIHREKIYIERSNGQKEYAELEDFILKRSKRHIRRGPKKKSRPGIAPIATGPPPDAFQEEGLERKGNNTVLSPEKKAFLLGESFQKVLQDAKAEPNRVNGELKGFRLTRIREDSIYLKVGLQNDDIIEEINGVPLTDVSGAIGLLQSLKNESEFEITVRRAGSAFNLNINVQ